LIIITGPFQAQVFRLAEDLGKSWQPRFGEFPQLQAAVVTEQAMMGASALLWIFTAWLLYKRERGTAGTIRKCFALGGVLRTLSALAIPIMGGLPPQIRAAALREITPSLIIGTVVITLWCVYLSTSKKVRELYGTVIV
jgi:hypothetical protein